MKFLSLFIVLIANATCINAQKIYNTKAGKISFFSSSPLEDISAKNGAVESYLSPATGEYFFSLNVKDFHFENDLMEEHFNENYLETDKYPRAFFKGFTSNISDINFSKDGTYPAVVKGNLTIHGITKEVAPSGIIEVKAGKPTAKSKFNILLKDYNVGGAVLNKMISSTIEITVECQYN